MLNIKTLSLIIALFFVGCGEQSPTSSNSATSFATVNKITQNEMLVAINQARSVARDCHDGLGLVEAAQPLAWNNELYAAAYEHSNDMAQSNTFDHYGSGTTSDITGANNNEKSYFNDRIRANDYLNYRTIGENIAGGQSGMAEVMEAWLNSPAHCRNIMNGDFKEIGIAVVTNANSEHGIYWTQNFGAKK